MKKGIAILLVGMGMTFTASAADQGRARQEVVQNLRHSMALHTSLSRFALVDRAWEGLASDSKMVVDAPDIATVEISANALQIETIVFTIGGALEVERSTNLTTWQQFFLFGNQESSQGGYGYGSISGTGSGSIFGGKFTYVKTGLISNEFFRIRNHAFIE